MSEPSPLEELHKILGKKRIEIKQLRTQLAATVRKYLDMERRHRESERQLAAAEAAIVEHNKHNQNPECYRIKLDGTAALDAAILTAYNSGYESGCIAKGKDAIAVATKPLVDALNWLLHLHCDVGKSGEKPVAQEWQDAIEAGKTALAQSKDR